MSLSLSNLSKPQSLIHSIVLQVQGYIHLPDPEPLYAVMGTVAANMLGGNPVWLMLVGGPATGKTTMATTQAALDRTFVISNVTGAASFLSATRKAEKTKDADGGLLRRTGDRGLWIIKDFSTAILSLRPDVQREVIGILRETFDGSWGREAGSDGGKHLDWQGKIGLIGASTGAVDQSRMVNQNLGERWIYYRYPEKDSHYGECMTALQNKLPEQKKIELQQIMQSFYSALELEWGCKVPCSYEKLIGHTCKPERIPRDFTHVESTRLTAMASLGSRMRSTLSRDPYNRSQVIDVPQKEAPTRLVEELGQLYLGLEFIGLDAGERWKLIGKIGMDSAPQLRCNMFLRVWQVSEVEQERIGVEALAGWLKCGVQTVRQHVEDLEAYGVLRKVSDQEVRLGEWALEQVEIAGWKRE